MKRAIRSSNYSGVKVKCKLVVEVEAEFDDLESDEQTVRYLVEQDLEDAGFDVNSCAVTEGSVELV